MSKPLIIYGAGGLGREVKSMLPYVQEKFNLIGFLDDGLKGKDDVDGIPVLGGLQWLEKRSDAISLIIAIGNPRIKATIHRQLEKHKHIHFPNLIHHQAHLQDMERITIGEGTVIGAGVIITTAVILGTHVLLNLNVTVGHDTVIGNFTSIMPGVNVAGNVTLGHEVMVGSGANIINNIKIGNFSTIGAGSVVNHDIPAASIAAGVPARVIK